jgi:hypothetical protein
MKIPATKPIHFSFTLHYGKINMGAIHRKSTAWRVPEPQNLKKRKKNLTVQHSVWQNPLLMVLFYHLLPPRMAPPA